MAILNSYDNQNALDTSFSTQNAPMAQKTNIVPSTDFSKVNPNDIYNISRVKNKSGSYDYYKQPGTGTYVQNVNPSEVSSVDKVGAIIQTPTGNYKPSPFLHEDEYKLTPQEISYFKSDVGFDFDNAAWNKVNLGDSNNYEIASTYLNKQNTNQLKQTLIPQNKNQGLVNTYSK